LDVEAVSTGGVAPDQTASDPLSRGELDSARGLRLFEVIPAMADSEAGPLFNKAFSAGTNALEPEPDGSEIPSV
jgi:hypothetical protein